VFWLESTNRGSQATVVTKVCALALNNFVPWAWHWFRVTFLAPRILRWLLNKTNSAPLVYMEVLTGDFMNTHQRLYCLTLYLLMWRIWWAPNNASKGQMGFNSAFRGLSQLIRHDLISLTVQYNATDICGHTFHPGAG